MTSVDELTRSRQPANDEATSASRRARPGRPPRGAGAIGALCVLLALAGIALAGLLIREALVTGGAVDGSSWLEQMITGIDGLAASATTFLLGLLALAVGVGLLWVATRRRSHPALRLRTATGTYLQRRSLVPLVEARAASVPGVVSARGRARRRHLDVDVATAGEDPRRVESAVADTVRGEVQMLARPLSVRVRAYPTLADRWGGTRS